MMEGAGEVFGILLLVEDLKVFIYDLLSGFGSALLDFVVRMYGLLLGVK